jgi:succinate dehydrogenase / fumarate reductase cytochrome b subunit
VFTRPKRRAPLPLELYRSAVGKKWVMALTGIAVMGFVFAHMVGNLHLYEGPRQVNMYGESLRELGGHLAPRTFVLWLLRVGLAGALLLHVHAALTLTILNRKARPDRYEAPRDWIAANFASRTMRWTGIIVGLYLLFHLADLTGGRTGNDFVRGDVYHNVVTSFSRPAVAALYVVANLALGVHLFHGAWSLFQSLGINNPRYNAARRLFAVGFAAAVVLPNCAFPIMVQAGVISEDERTWPSQPVVEQLLERGVPEAQIREAHEAMEDAGYDQEQIEQEFARVFSLNEANDEGVDR